jgi:probable addiction module antidote protein
MAEKISDYNAADYLKTPEDVAEYLEMCFEEAQGDPDVIAAALGNAARASGMPQLARETGLTREGLYKALSAEAGNPVNAASASPGHVLAYREGCLD